MAKQNTNRNIKATRNLKSATINTLHTIGCIATKGIKKTAKWLTADNARATHRNHMNDLERNANYHLASMALSNRRLNRLSDSVRRLINTGRGDSFFEIAVGWLIDHAFHLWGLLWDLIWSIVSNILMTIFSVLLVIMFNVIFFYTLFWLLFL